MDFAFDSAISLLASNYITSKLTNAVAITAVSRQCISIDRNSVDVITSTLQY